MAHEIIEQTASPSDGTDRHSFARCISAPLARKVEVTNSPPVGVIDVTLPDDRAQ
jgi:hypothetical protein